MNWEARSNKIYPILPLIDTRLLNASEFLDSETEQRLIVVERGQYDTEKRTYEQLAQFGMPLFEREFDQDTVRYLVPAGTETLKSYMPKFIQNIEIDSFSNLEPRTNVPFYELGRLLGSMSINGIKYRLSESILEKIAIAPDFSGRYGMQNFLIPPLNFSFGRTGIMDLVHCLNEVRSLRLKKHEYEYLVESLGAGFVSRYGQISA